MNGLKLVLLGLIGVAALTPASAQDDAKLRNDPTYSTRNYKQPNKAETARQWEPEASVSTRRRASRRVTMGDYKRSTGNDVRSAGVSFPVRSVPADNRNYKMQQTRPVGARPAEKRAVATLPRQQSEQTGN